MRGAAIEFIEHYRHDSRYRWSADDLTAQQQFVRDATGQCRWADWSNEIAALQILQAGIMPHARGADGVWEAILLAGPVTELVAPATLLCQSIAQLQSKGKLVGIVSCLRDNSPESQLFIQISAGLLWPYYTAEDLSEMIREAGLFLDSELTQFVPIPSFNRAVLKDELRFKGYRQVFRQLESDGYDPMEVGWGELRFVATLAELDASSA